MYCCVNYAYIMVTPTPLEIQEMVLEELGKRRGEYAQIARDADVSYSWLLKFVHGERRNPTAKRLSQLQRALGL